MIFVEKRVLSFNFTDFCAWIQVLNGSTSANDFPPTEYQLDLKIAKNGISSKSPRVKPYGQKFQKYCFKLDKSVIIFLRYFFSRCPKSAIIDWKWASCEKNELQFPSTDPRDPKILHKKFPLSKLRIMPIAKDEWMINSALSYRTAWGVCCCSKSEKVFLSASRFQACVCHIVGKSLFVSTDRSPLIA